MSDAEATKVTALAAVYAGTRADNSTILNVSLAILGAGVAYIAATLATVDKFGNGIDWVVVAILPVPLWIVAAYHSILTIISMVNAVAAQYTENQLLKIAGVGEAERAFMGYQRAEMITNITHKDGRLPHKASVGLTFGGTGALVVAYTIYMIVLVWVHADGWRGIVAVVFLILYTLAAVIVALSWKYGIEHANESVAAVLKRTSDTSGSAKAEASE